MGWECNDGSLDCGHNLNAVGFDFSCLLRGELSYISGPHDRHYCDNRHLYPHSRLLDRNFPYLHFNFYLHQQLYLYFDFHG